ncbi:MAG: hypothetical protein JNK05_09390 [Myxococcales bacterium]|nr:hypothetical protein [Myxococcales bacterium]
MIRSIRTVGLAAFAFIVAAGCGGSSSSGASNASSGATDNSASSGGSSTPAAGPRFVVAAGALTPDTSPRPAMALTLEADGTLRSTREVLGRFDGNRYVLPNGNEVLRVDPDGTIQMPWRRGATGPWQFTAEGLQVDTPQGREVLSVDNDGVLHAGSNPGGGRFAPYQPAMRDTVLMMRFVPLLVLAYGLSQQQQQAGATPPSSEQAPASSTAPAQ